MAAVEIVEECEFSEIEQPAFLRLVTVQTTPRELRSGPSLAQRRASRARMLQRRRRTLIAVALITGLAFLSWPGHAFGGTTNTGLSTDLANSSVLASGMVYVVQPGDTVSSIADMVNPVDPKFVRVELIRELGSSYVVPGEHVLIP